MGCTTLAPLEGGSKLAVHARRRGLREDAIAWSLRSRATTPRRCFVVGVPERHRAPTESLIGTELHSVAGPDTVFVVKGSNVKSRARGLGMSPSLAVLGLAFEIVPTVARFRPCRS